MVLSLPFSWCSLENLNEIQKSETNNVQQLQNKILSFQYNRYIYFLLAVNVKYVK
jgi:hypothetical protein